MRASVRIQYRGFAGFLLFIVLLTSLTFGAADAQRRAPERSAAVLTMAPDQLEQLISTAISDGGGRLQPRPGEYTYPAYQPLPEGFIASPSGVNPPEPDDLEYQNAIINWVLKNAMAFPYQPNTPQDFENIRAWAATQQQINQAAEATALLALQQSDSVLQYGQAVLAAGGDPNVFFAQNQLPYSYNASLLGPGAGFNALDPIGTTLTAINLSFARLSLYPSPFVTNLNNFFFNPASNTTSLALQPAVAPNSCPAANPLLPTTIRFVNLSTGYIRISHLNYLCQEVFYAILLPNTQYLQLTFVGQTWRFRDAFTGDLILGQPEFTIPNTNPQTYTIINVPGATTGQAMGQAGALDQAQGRAAGLQQAPSANSLDGLKARYGALAQMQLGNYYSDPAVSQLRAEFNQQIIARLEADPLYLYWSHERTQALDRIRVGRPSYARMAALEAEIASWRSPAADEATQRARYATRQEYQLLQSRLDEELAAFFAANPDVAVSLESLNSWLLDRIDQVQLDPAFVRWQADWDRRWYQAYFASPEGAATVQMAQQISADYPVFQEYQQVRRELVDLLPSLNDSPPVKRFANVKAEVLGDVQANSQVRDLYAQHLNRQLAILNGTQIPVLTETFYNQLSGLLNSDPTYLDLQDQEREVIQALRDRQGQIHAAVRACYDRDPDCDPYGDRAVRELLYSDRARQLISASGSYYEAFNRFWYSFYAGQDYLDLENQTKADLRAPLSAVQPQIQALQAEFQQGLRALPHMSRLRQASNTMMTELCAAPPAGAARESGPISDVTAEYCARLEHLQDLDSQLGAMSSSTESLWHGSIYLPLIRR